MKEDQPPESSIPDTLRTNRPSAGKTLSCSSNSNEGVSGSLKEKRALRFGHSCLCSSKCNWEGGRTADAIQVHKAQLENVEWANSDLSLMKNHHRKVQAVWPADWREGVRRSESIEHGIFGSD